MGPISKLRNNKQQSLGPKCSMSEVGNPPPNNLDKPHELPDRESNNLVGDAIRLGAVYICDDTHN